MTLCNRKDRVPAPAITWLSQGYECSLDTSAQLVSTITSMKTHNQPGQGTPVSGIRNMFTHYNTNFFLYYCYKNIIFSIYGKFL